MVAWAELNLHTAILTPSVLAFATPWWMAAHLVDPEPGRATRLLAGLVVGVAAGGLALVVMGAAHESLSDAMSVAQRALIVVAAAADIYLVLGLAQLLAARRVVRVRPALPATAACKLKVA